MQYDGGSRFELVIVAPLEDPKGLLYLGTELRKLLEKDASLDKNIIDKVVEEVQHAKDTFTHETSLTMPEFDVATDMNVVECLRKVTPNANS